MSVFAKAMVTIGRRQRLWDILTFFFAIMREAIAPMAEYINPPLWYQKMPRPAGFSLPHNILYNCGIRNTAYGMV